MIPVDNAFAGDRASPEVEALTQELSALARSVRASEARAVAAVAYSTAALLAREYHVVGPALFQNLLVNTGIRRRGLCYQWTEDLMARLQELHPQTLELHWAVARPGTFREHNCVVLTAKRQALASGIVLDAWRHSGRLYAGPVAHDHYPWHEDDSEYARARMLRAAKR